MSWALAPSPVLGRVCHVWYGRTSHSTVAALEYRPLRCIYNAVCFLCSSILVVISFLNEQLIRPSARARVAEPRTLSQLQSE